MKRPLVCLFFLLFSISSFSQDFGLDTFKLPHPNAIFVNPMAMLNFYQSSIDIGYERRLKEYWSVEGEIGIITPAYPWRSGQGETPERTNGRGFILRAIPKYHSESFFVGWSNGFTFHNYQSVRFEQLGSENLISYNVRQRIYSSLVVVGGKMETNRIFLEISTGAGFRLLGIWNDTNADIQNYPSLNRFSFYVEPEEDGTYFRFTVPLNLKIGYRF